MSMSAAQCRAARALLGWSQDTLAKWSLISKATIANFEAGKRTPTASNLNSLRVALEIGGVEFIPYTEDQGPGVRLRKPEIPTIA